MVNADDQSVYGMRDGCLTHISGVLSGLACACYCAECGQHLVAKKGDLRRHHFAHSEITACRGGPETVLHLLAKELIRELTNFELPPYEFQMERRAWGGEVIRHAARVFPGRLVAVDRAEVEAVKPGFVADAILKTSIGPVIIEVAVTHRVERKKLRMLRAHNKPVIEIRLAEGDALLSRADLREKLRRGLTGKFWLFHPNQRDAERVFFEKLKAARAKGRRQRARPSPARTRPLDRTHTPADRLHMSYDVVEYDKKMEAFWGQTGRYPTAEECLSHWPHLWSR
jgi:Competence protein CoiA-like family